MSSSTTPDGIVYPDASDPIAPLNAVFQDLADSVQTALDARPPIADIALDDISNVDAPTPTEGQVLTYDQVNSKWINASAAGAPVLPLMPGGFYRSTGMVVHSAFNAVAPFTDTDHIYLTPFYVPTDTAIAAVWVQTDAASAATIDLGLYNVDVYGRPAIRVWEGEAYSDEPFQNNVEALVDQELEAGWYWLGWKLRSGSAQTAYVGDISFQGNTNAYLWNRVGSTDFEDSVLGFFYSWTFSIDEPTPPTINPNNLINMPSKTYHVPTGFLQVAG